MVTTDKEAFFKELLNKDLIELLAQSNRAISGSVQFDERHTDFLDIASFESNAGLSLRISERQSKLIAKIKYALEKLGTGEFGICEECGEEISEERLRARPVAALCIECKRRQERSEKQRA